MQDTVIIGAGPAGLSTAYHLNGPSWLILEQHERVGGLCRSIEDQGFTFDYAGHIMFTNSDYVKDVMYPKLLGDNVHWQDREAWVYSKGVYTRYPFQASTYGLPEEVVKDCIMGAVKARYEGDHGKEPQNFKEYIEMFCVLVAFAARHSAGKKDSIAISERRTSRGVPKTVVVEIRDSSRRSVARRSGIRRPAWSAAPAGPPGCG